MTVQNVIRELVRRQIDGGGTGLKVCLALQDIICSAGLFLVPRSCFTYMYVLVAYSSAD